MTRVRNEAPHVPSAHRSTQTHRFGAAIAEVKNPRNYRRPNNPFRRNNPIGQKWQPSGQQWQPSFNPVQNVQQHPQQNPQQYTQQQLQQNLQQYLQHYSLPYTYSPPQAYYNYDTYYYQMAMAMAMASSNVPTNYDHNSNATRIPVKGETNEFAKANSTIRAPRQDNAHSQKRNEDNQQPSICSICWDKPVNSVFYGCGHMSMCYDCAVHQWRKSAGGHCTICRATIRDVIRVYRS